MEEFEVKEQDIAHLTRMCPNVTVWNKTVVAFHPTSKVTSCHSHTYSITRDWNYCPHLQPFERPHSQAVEGVLIMNVDNFNNSSLLTIPNLDSIRVLLEVDYVNWFPNQT